MRVSAFGVVLLAGLSLALLSACDQAQRPRKTGKAQETARPVRVTCAELRPMARVITATGTLAAQEKSTLSAKVPGRLQHLNVDVGSVVHQDDVLAQIEPQDYELKLRQAAAALAQARTALGLPADGEDDRVELERVSAVKQAKALLEEATKNRDRVKNLSQSGIASQSELDSVEAAYTVALTRYDTALDEGRTHLAAVAQRRAEYELARKQLADAAIRAPFDGAVQNRPASIGEYVAAGTPILELVKTDPLRLRLQVPERECALVHAGQAVHLSLEGDTNVHSGHIARLCPALDEQSRMLLVEADVPARGALRPGLFARAQINIKEDDQALSVPANALTVFAGIEKVVVVQNGKALEKVVTTGRRGADWAEIVSGLGAGESIVLNPGGLRTGQPVTVEGRAGSPSRPATVEGRAGSPSQPPLSAQAPHQG